MRLRVLILVAVMLIPTIAPALCATWCAPPPDAGAACCSAEGSDHAACPLTGEPVGSTESCCAVCPLDDGAIPVPQPPPHPAPVDLHIPVAIIVPWAPESADAPAQLARLALRTPCPWSMGASISLNAVLCIWRN